jgi:hypothetical protein
VIKKVERSVEHVDEEGDMKEERQESREYV